jgi:hypothetical protein
MRLRGVLVVGCFLFATASATLANPIDPGIIVDSNDPPATDLGGITNGLNGVQVTGDANVIYKLEDNTGIITSLTFTTLINPNLSQATINADFTCGQDSLNQGGLGYFLHCSVGYTPTNGLDLTHGVLTYSFFGVNPPEGSPDELCPAQDCEINEQEGIPTGGSFFIHLLGWIPDAPGSGPLYNGLPTFSSTFTATPEPSALPFLAGGLLLVAGIAKLRGRNRQRKLS